MSAAAELVRVVLVGARGRLGRTAVEACRRAPGLELTASLDRGDDVRAALLEAPADVGLDATVAGRGAEHALWMLAAGIRPVVGTSGVTEDELDTLDEAARVAGLAALVVPNFSRGLLLLERAAALLAPHFAEGRIVERHHATKRDAPSATARHLARTMEEAGGPPADTIPIRSVRQTGSYAHHELVLGTGEETLTLRHDMTGPAGFAAGIVLALRGVALLEPGVHVGLACVEPASREGLR